MDGGGHVWVVVTIRGCGQWCVLTWPVMWLATHYHRGWWWLRVVADGGGWWQLLATVVTWQCWVVFDNGGGLQSLWPFVAVCVLWAVVVCCCRWLLWVSLHSLCRQSLSVIVCVDGGGEKSSHNQTLLVIHHK